MYWTQTLKCMLGRPLSYARQKLTGYHFGDKIFWWFRCPTLHWKVRPYRVFEPLAVMTTKLFLWGLVHQMHPSMSSNGRHHIDEWRSPCVGDSKEVTTQAVHKDRTRFYFEVPTGSKSFLKPLPQMAVRLIMDLSFTNGLLWSVVIHVSLPNFGEWKGHTNHPYSILHTLELYLCYWLYLRETTHLPIPRCVCILDKANMLIAQGVPHWAACPGPWCCKTLVSSSHLPCRHALVSWCPGHCWSH